MIDWEKVEVSPGQKIGTKLRIAALGLALIGSGAAVWLALEGQRLRMQQATLGERLARYDTLATELGSLEERLKGRTAEFASLQASLADIEQQRSKAATALNEAVIAREKAEAARAAAVNQRGDILTGIDKERETLAQLKTSTAAARTAYEIAQAETAAIGRDIDDKSKRRAALESEVAKLQEDKGKLQEAIAVLTPELRSMLQQKNALTAEIERGEKRADALRAEAQREQDRTAQLRLEVPDLKLDAERLRGQVADLKKEMEDLARQRPTLQAQAQILQKQFDNLQGGVRQRSELLDQTEKRLSESFARLAESEARKATYEARAKELQDQIREHTKRAADDKREADRVAAELARVQDQSRNLDPQRKEVGRLASLREEGERQLGEVNAHLAEKRLELQRLHDDIKASEEQKRKLSRLIAPGEDLAVPTKTGAVASEAVDLVPKN